MAAKGLLLWAALMGLMVGYRQGSPRAAFVPAFEPLETCTALFVALPKRDPLCCARCRPSQSHKIRLLLLLWNTRRARLFAPSPARGASPSPPKPVLKLARLLGCQSSVWPRGRPRPASWLLLCPGTCRQDLAKFAAPLVVLASRLAPGREKESWEPLKRAQRPPPLPQGRRRRRCRRRHGPHARPRLPPRGPVCGAHAAQHPQRCLVPGRGGQVQGRVDEAAPRRCPPARRRCTARIECSAWPVAPCTQATCKPMPAACMHSPPPPHP